MSDGSESEEVILSEADHHSADLLSASGEEELDAGVHEEAAMDIPRAAEDDGGSEEEQEQPAPAASQESAATAAASSSADGAPSQPQQQQQESAPAESSGAAPPQKPAGLGLGAGLGGPRGLGGLGLKPPAPKAAEPQQQQQQQQPQQQQPKGLGLGGLGLGPKLPAKQPASSSSTAAAANGTAAPPADTAASGAAAATAAAGTAAAAQPAKPAGGVGLLPPKPKAAATAGDASTPASQQQQQQPPKPAGGLGSLPARQPAGGIPALGARPAVAAGSSSGSSSGQPGSSGGGSAFRPQLGSRPAAVAAAGGGGQPGAAVVRAPAAAAAAAAAGGGSGGVVDPDEPKSMQKMRSKLQELRVDTLRAGMRLGYAVTSEQLGQWLGVLERIEKVNAPPLRRRVDVNRLAVADATELNASSAADSPLGLHIKMLVVGMTGTGKSELINALLGRPAQATNAFRESTKSVKVVKGRIAGMAVTAIDTPGLHASADAQSANRSLLKAIKGAWKKHKPNFLIYVDRLDATRPSFGEMGLLSNLTATLGQGAWKKAVVVLTHANAARDKLGREYMTVVKQRKNIVTNIIRQAAGEMQLRINLHSVDTHPETPRTPGGEMVVYDQVTPMALAPSPVPWRPALLLNMLGLYAFETGVELIQKATPKAKTGAGGAKQQDMFKQMMRSRLPPTSYFVEQLVEGVAKPEGWAVPEDPFAAETDDEEAEEFKHIYYKIMYALAKKGDARAQKEYAAWVRRLDKNRRAYQEAYDNEEVEQLAAYGYEGYVTEALDLGPSFDPEDCTDHRYQYPIADSQFAIMPTLDYYGYEHEDAITGFVAEWSGQPWNVDGWGGVPVDVTATIEKDKTTTCLQAEANASLVHSVAPFGNRHITQLSGAFELLRPNVKDILYTLEVNTFKDGMLGRSDHAGAGLMLTRMAEGGNIRKGPVGVGVRIQENMRVGPLKVEAVAAQVRGETPMGGRDEGWAARAFVLHDWIPSLAMNFDWYQERTKDESATIGGWAAALAYDFGLPGGYPAAMEVDWVSGSDVVHVDASLYAPYDWKPAWLLLIPAVNWAKDWWRRWRDSRKGGPAGEEEELEEEKDEEGGMMGGADLGAMLQGMSGPDAQAMLQQLMQSGGLQQLMGGARMG